MAENNKNTRGREEGQGGKSPIGRSGRRSGAAPRTSETGAQNSGGQTQRAADKSKKQKHGGGR